MVCINFVKNGEFFRQAEGKFRYGGVPPGTPGFLAGFGSDEDLRAEAHSW
jgi:hypothetical protein